MTDVPDPELVAQLVTDDGQLPTSVRRLWNTIDKTRWDVTTTESRGPVITANGGWTGRVADCVVIELSDDTGGGALAYFLDGKYTGGFTWVWCTTCVDPAFKHADNTPVAIGYRDLCRLVSSL